MLFDTAMHTNIVTHLRNPCQTLGPHPRNASGPPSRHVLLCPPRLRRKGALWEPVAEVRAACVAADTGTRLGPRHARARGCTRVSCSGDSEVSVVCLFRRCACLRAWLPF